MEDSTILGGCYKDGIKCLIWGNFQLLWEVETRLYKFIVNNITDKEWKVGTIYKDINSDDIYGNWFIILERDKSKSAPFDENAPFEKGKREYSPTCAKCKKEINPKHVDFWVFDRKVCFRCWDYLINSAGIAHIPTDMPEWVWKK